MKKAKENWIKVGKVVDGQIVPPPPPEPEEFSIDLSPMFSSNESPKKDDTEVVVGGVSLFLCSDLSKMFVQISLM